MPPRQESTLKAKCLKEAQEHLKGFVIFQHQEVRRIGVPDVSITGLSKTSWWEFKHGTPDFDSTGLQELTMLRLAGAGFARYIIYLEDKDGESKRILIVHPKEFKDLIPEASCVGFNHRWVAEYIRKIHFTYR
jgi:hypothetical protein